MAFPDFPLTNEDSTATADQYTLSHHKDLNNNSTEHVSATTQEHIRNISNLNVSNKSILEKFEAMNKCIDYFQQQLQEHKGSINELEFSLTSHKRTQGPKEDTDDDLHHESGCGLFPFIQKCLLNETKYYDTIRWVNKAEQEFKIVDPDNLATLWGQEKRKEGMTKRKLTRSLAYLVNAKKKLRRSSSRTFIYQIINKFGRSMCPSPESNWEESPTALEKSQPTPTMEQMKQILRQNPKYLQVLIDVQKQQKESIGSKNILKAGSKRSLNTQDQQVPEKSVKLNQESVFKTPQQQSQNNFIDTASSFNWSQSYNNNNYSPSPANDSYVSFSPLSTSSDGSSNFGQVCDNNNNFMSTTTSNFVSMSDSSNSIFSGDSLFNSGNSSSTLFNNNSTSNFMQQMSTTVSTVNFTPENSTSSIFTTPVSDTNSYQQVTSVPTNFTNPIAHSLVSDVSDFGSIVPTFCLNRNSGLNNDIFAYLQ